MNASEELHRMQNTIELLSSAHECELLIAGLNDLHAGKFRSLDAIELDLESLSEACRQN